MKTRIFACVFFIQLIIKVMSVGVYWNVKQRDSIINDVIIRKVCSTELHSKVYLSFYFSFRSTVCICHRYIDISIYRRLGETVKDFSSAWVIS